MSNRLLIFLFLSFSMWMCKPKTPAPLPLSERNWEEITAVDQSIPTKRHEAAFVSVDEKLYLLGGRGIKPVDIFDLKTQKWTQGPESPIELHHFQPIVYKGLIYIIGAMTGPYPAEKPVEQIMIYDTQKNEWIIGSDIPENRLRGSTGLALDGDNIYVVCGIKNGHLGDHKKWMDLYNIKTESWTVLADAPRARDHFQAVFHEGKVYSLGGRTTMAEDNPFKNTIKEVDIYDVKKNEWTRGPNDLPTERAGNAAINLGDYILVVGGESFSQNEGHSEVEGLNSVTLEWKEFSDLPIGRHGTGLSIVDKSMFICSGSGNRGGGPELSDLFVLDIK